MRAGAMGPMDRAAARGMVALQVCEACGGRAVSAAGGLLPVSFG